ncbi:MAG: tetratricopeptide repeat protein [Bacteroidia bacterium]
MTETYIVQSRLLRGQGLLEESLHPLSIALTLAPEKIELWLEKLDVLEQKNLEQALQVVYEALVHHPQAVPLWHKAYKYYTQLGKWRHAYQALDKLTTLEALNPRWWVHKAFLAIRLHEEDTAEFCIQKALEVSGNSPEVLYYKALFYARLGDTGKARQSLEAAIAQDPQYEAEARNEEAFNFFFAQGARSD